jgi:hypothetical protein
MRPFHSILLQLYAMVTGALPIPCNNWRFFWYLLIHANSFKENSEPSLLNVGAGIAQLV